MSQTLTIELPDSLSIKGLSNDEARRELAVALYAKRTIGESLARRMAGLDIMGFNRLLSEHGIYSHYDVQDFEEDMKTLKKLEVSGLL